MATHRFLIAFSNAGSPATGLTVTVDALRASDGGTEFTGQACAEVGNGWYQYVYTSGSYDETYLATYEVTAGTSDSAIGFGSAEPDQALSRVYLTNRRKIKTDNTQDIYDDDASTVIATFDLKDISGSATTSGITEVDPQ